MTQAQQAQQDRMWQRNVTWLQMLPAFLTLLCSGIAVTVSYANRQAVIELRVSTLEKKDEYYDSLVQRRNDQLAEMNKSLATLASQRESDHETLREIRDELRNQGHH